MLLKKLKLELPYDSAIPLQGVGTESKTFFFFNLGNTVLERVVEQPQKMLCLRI